MSKKMLINANTLGEARVAVINNGVLDEFNMESSGAIQRGNIYSASVVHVDRGLEAAFIDYGAERHGFIPLNQIPSKYFSAPGESRGKSQRFRIKKGAKLLLQVDREPIGNKCATFSGYISLPGRYLVAMPFSSGGGISKKIEDLKERDRLKKLIQQFELPSNFKLIIRTAGLSVSYQELKNEYEGLMERWKSVEREFPLKRENGLIYEDSSLVIRTVRDYFSKDIDEVVIDNREVFKSVSDFFKKSIPQSVSVLKLYHSKIPLFTKFGVEEQAENLFSRKVPLASGGSIVIDSTEALVAIDINSGGGKGTSGQEELALEINKTAAVEIARQLRLRDLGGLIVIDFIDMKSQNNRNLVKKILREEMARDKARVETGSISKFGLLEMSRQRIKESIYSSQSMSCPTCQGSGIVRSVEFLSTKLLRKITLLASKTSLGSTIQAVGSKEVIELLNNEKRKELQKLESELFVTIQLFSHPGLVPGKETLTVQPIAKEGDRAQVKNNDNDNIRKKPEIRTENKETTDSNQPTPKTEEKKDAQPTKAKEPKVLTKSSGPRKNIRKRQPKKTGNKENVDSRQAQPEKEEQERKKEAPPAKAVEPEVKAKSSAPPKNNTQGKVTPRRRPQRKPRPKAVPTKESS